MRKHLASRYGCFACFWILCNLTTPSLTMAQTNSDTMHWLNHAPKPPPFRVPDSKRAWEKQKQKTREELGELLGNLPKRGKPAVEVLSREEKQNYILEKFQFDNGAGATVPGYFVLPKKPSNQKVPAVLYHHWHGGQYEIGKKEIFQAQHTAEIPAERFAQMGIATLAIDAYCFGERNGRGPGGPGEKGSAGELTASKFQMWVGRSLWGMIVRDDQLALDYLLSRPEVDPDRIAAMGMSMGATRTWWLMALDDRIRTGISICCLTRYQDLIEQQLLKAHGIYYYVPGLFAKYDMESVVALIAPRLVLFMDGDQDGTAPASGIYKIQKAVRPVWSLYNRESAFRSEVYSNQGHLYTPEMWQQTLNWLEKELLLTSAAK